MITLFARKGWGSTIIEAQLEWYGLEYRLEEVGDLFASAEARASLSRVNPLAQIPTLVLPGGEVMTESAAITLYLADRTGRTDLVPGPGEPERAAFLRWLVFLVANVYPTFTYADDPARFVALQEAQPGFLASVADYARRLWTFVDDAASARPWFLGHRFSAIDIYIAVMTRWRPGREWCATNAGRLSAIALAADQQERLAGTWRRNFPAGD
jgi:GST-like protein